MIVKNVELTLLKINKKEGVSKKSGKDYRFYSAQCVDADANVFGFNLSDEVVADEPTLKKLSDVKNVAVKADIRFTPKGFDLGGTITSLKLV